MPPAGAFFLSVSPVVPIKEKHPSRVQPSRGLSPELNAMLHSPSSVLDRRIMRVDTQPAAFNSVPSVWHCVVTRVCPPPDMRPKTSRRSPVPVAGLPFWAARLPLSEVPTDFEK
jgi:hypothetical protein